MKKNITVICSVLTAILVVLAFQHGQMTMVCPICSDGDCQAAHHKGPVLDEIIPKHANCCSDQSEKTAPCCNIEEFSFEDGRFFLLTHSRVWPPDFFHIKTADDENPGVVNQSGIYTKKHFSINPSYSVPIYLKNLSILC